MPATPTSSFWPQPGVAISLSALAAVVLLSGTPLLLAQFATLTTLGLLSVLACFSLAVLAELTTVHVNYNAKATLGGPALLLLVVLLPLPLCVVVAYAARLTACIIARRARQTFWVDILTNTARSGLIAATAAAAAVLTSELPFLAQLLIGMAIVIGGDILSAPLEFGPITGRRPFRLLPSIAHDVVMVEGPLYVLAVLVALLLRHEPAAVPLLLLPCIVVYRLLRSSRQVQGATLELLENLADAVDLRDPYTGGHSRRVAEYTGAILRELEMEGADYTLIVTAARVHDVGKIGISDAILHKPGRLTPDERSKIEEHPVLGATLIARHTDFARGVAIVRHHHERMDGRGYPDGLSGTDIPFGARVIAVADTYDALTSDRPYRRGMSAQEAALILIDGMGSQWQSDLVLALLRHLGLSHLRDQVRPTALQPSAVSEPPRTPSAERTIGVLR